MGATTSQRLNDLGTEELRSLLKRNDPNGEYDVDEPTGEPLDRAGLDEIIDYDNGDGDDDLVLWILRTRGPISEV